MSSEEKDQRPAVEDVLTISNDDGRVLLRVGPEGRTFDGEIEDMGEAAETFVGRVRLLLGGGVGG